MNVFQRQQKSRQKNNNSFLSDFSKKYNNFCIQIAGKKLANGFILFFIVVLLALCLADQYVTSKTFQVHFLPSSFNVKAAAYPKLTNVLGTSTTELFQQSPDISAQAAVILDADSKTILYGKNENLRFSLASTTKIMTAITALSFYHLNDVLTVKSLTEGSQVGFTVGQQVSFEDLLYGMLLPSGNDAALAIAENYSGGFEAFVEKMNQNAADWHLSNTHFADPAGLDDSNYSTSSDLARLTSIAIQNSELAKIVDTKEKIITDVSGKNIYKLQNLNLLLGFEGVNGVKTGTTDEAGQVLVTSKIEQGHTLIIVVMKSDDRFSDTEKLLTLVNGNVRYVNPSH